MQRYLYSELDRLKCGPINQTLFLKRVYETFYDARLFFLCYLYSVLARTGYFGLQRSLLRTLVI